MPASTAGMAAPDVPGAHYARQRIERVFDVGKNHASLLPPRARSEEAPGGHLPPAFCATALSCRPRPGIPAGASSMPQALAAARNQKCEACDDKAVTCEPTSAANELYRAIGAKCPVWLVARFGTSNQQNLVPSVSKPGTAGKVVWYRRHRT